MKMGIGIAFLPLSMSLVIGVLAVLLLVGILKGRVEIKEKPICEQGRRLAGRDGGPASWWGT